MSEIADLITVETYAQQGVTSSSSMGQNVKNKNKLYFGLFGGP